VWKNEFRFLWRRSAIQDGDEDHIELLFRIFHVRQILLQLRIAARQLSKHRTVQQGEDLRDGGFGVCVFDCFAIRLPELTQEMSRSCRRFDFRGADEISREASPAGIGLSLSLTGAVAIALHPLLSRVTEDLLADLAHLVSEFFDCVAILGTSGNAILFLQVAGPFDGVVTQRSVAPGDLVRESSEVGRGEPLFVVSQMTTGRVHIPIPEADAALVSEGDTVTLSFPSFSAEEPITHPVTRLSRELDPSTRTMLVEVEVDNVTGKLLPGMFGQATISLSNKIAANMLPARAVRFDESGEAYVYVVGENDKVSVVNVTTGIDDGHSIQILTGLQSGQQVVDAHLKRFTDEQKVTVLSD